MWRDICNEKKCDPHHDIEGNHGLCQLADALSRDRATDEQGISDRRCDQADTKVQDQHCTEVCRIHSKGSSDREKNRCNNQNDCGHIHDHAANQKEDVHHQKDEILVGCYTQNPIRKQCRNVQVGYQPRETAGGVSNRCS